MAASPAPAGEAPPGATGTFSGSGAGSGYAKQTKPIGSMSDTEGKGRATPEGVAVQRAGGGLKVRELTQKDL